jgi:sugar lactone lactonase YvrE
MRACTPLPLLLLSLLACQADPAAGPLAGPAMGMEGFPDVIQLPAGFWPEGITFGRGTTFYVGSLATGAIWRGDARTGVGSLLVPSRAGEQVGMKYDVGCDRLIVAGGSTGTARVYDAASGAELAVLTLADGSDPTLVNDVVLTADAAYFTDSFRPAIYRLALNGGCTVPTADALTTLELTGDFEFDPDAPVGNANGIVAAPSGNPLIFVNMADGQLYRVDPETGATRAIDLGGAWLDGDGMLLVGHTLYVVEGPFNRVAVVRLDAKLASGTVERVITDQDLQFPATIALHGNGLYAVNARFDVAYAPDVAYQVVRLPR